MGSMVMVVGFPLPAIRSFTNTLHARRLTPLMRMASEPQTPWAQERRKVTEPSRYHLM